MPGSSRVWTRRKRKSVDWFYKKTLVMIIRAGHKLRIQIIEVRCWSEPVACLEGEGLIWQRITLPFPLPRLLMPLLDAFDEFEAVEVADDFSFGSGGREC